VLKEIDKKWSLPDERREVIYRNLDPGSYTFMLKGINSDGIETPDYISINFTIAKAFRETKVFYVSLILLIIVITIFLTIYLFKRNQKSKEEKQKLKSDLLNLQMNSFLKEFDPHFTFNAISSVGSLIMKNDRKAAYLYLTRLSSLLRASLKDSGSLIKPVAEEVDFVRNYCELQKLRFGDRFNYSINIADDVNLLREVPKMTIQTFVENSLKHGIESRRSGGSIEISLTHVESSLKIVVRDNGVGIKVSRELKTEGTGYGIKTIYGIFEIVNKGNPVKATLDIHDIQDVRNGIYETGTEVVIVIPDNYSFRINELSFSSSED
jgi:sensor histidine kinase YesM